MTRGTLILPSLYQALSPDLKPRTRKIVPKQQIFSSLHLPGVQERESHTPGKAGELTPLVLYIFEDGAFLKHWAIKHLIPPCAHCAKILVYRICLG